MRLHLNLLFKTAVVASKVQPSNHDYLKRSQPSTASLVLSAGRYYRKSSCCYGRTEVYALYHLLFLNLHQIMQQCKVCFGRHEQCLLKPYWKGTLELFGLFSGLWSTNKSSDDSVFCNLSFFLTLHPSHYSVSLPIVTLDTDESYTDLNC